MKGVKYNLSVRSPTGEENNFSELNMNQLIGTATQEILDKYKVEVKISRHVVYNLIHRDNVNKFLKSVCTIQKC